MKPDPAVVAGPPLRRFLAPCRRTLAAAVALTLALGMVPIAGAIYLLMLFDIAFASRSVATIVGILAMMLGTIGIVALIAPLRNRLLARIGASLFVALERPVSRDLADAVDARVAARASHALIDIERLRAFFAGGGAAAFADLLLIPLVLPVLLCLGALMALAWLATVAIIATIMYRELGHDLALKPDYDSASLDADPALMRALGIGGHVAASRRAARAHSAALAQRADLASTRSLALTRTVLLAAWTTFVAIGSLLAINDAASIGAIAATAFIAQRALGAFEPATAHARDLAEVRRGWRRIQAVLATVVERPTPLVLPAPTASLTVDALTLITPDTRQVILREVGFALDAGDMLVVAGPTAAGKSALLRALAAAWPPTVGTIRLDGAALDQWARPALAQHIGYLPQHGDLFDGTIAQNIARFDPDASSAAVLAAAMAAGVHDMIVRMSRGYDTLVGATGLSSGERQRIALARALYGEPFLLLLDEPAAYADVDGRKALAQLISDARGRGAIVIAIGHESALVDQASHLLILRAGRVQDLGSTDEVRARLVAPRPPVRHHATPGLATAQE